ncbi:MAG: hypothetical protein QXV52_03270 [Nitrososphaeria archaeon]
MSAVIIDGLAIANSNSEFVENAKNILIKAGFEVDVYQGNDVTISLLMNIRKYNVLILRVHSAIDPTDKFLYLFSTEKYNPNRYIFERFTGVVKVAYPLFRNDELYFVLRADLLGYSSTKEFNNSNIIIMGCNVTDSKLTIIKLFEKGFKNIIGWDGYVDLAYSDKITLILLKTVYEDKIDFPEAVEKIMNEYNADPVWKSRLKCLTKNS